MMDILIVTLGIIATACVVIYLLSDLDENGEPREDWDDKS
jgi:hypothetical protein